MELVVVVLVTAFLVWRLHPSLLLANTLPAGGDLSLHRLGPTSCAKRPATRLGMELGLV